MNSTSDTETANSIPSAAVLESPTPESASVDISLSETSKQGAPSSRRFRIVAGISFALFTIFYILFVSRQYFFRGLFEYIGVDYRVWWSAANVWHEFGLSEVYDLSKLKLFQHVIYMDYAAPRHPVPFTVMPIPYLPLFVLPFFHAWLFDPLPGLLAFDAYEFSLLLLYLVRFTRALRGRYHIEWWWVLPCLPVFLDLLFANVNIWMILFSGEFMIAVSNRREGRAGVALAFMLLKPQSLLLIVPALVLSRSWRIFAGFSISAAVILLASLAIGGEEAFYGIFRIVSDYRTEYANYPESMMNLRMIGVNSLDFLDLSVWPAIYMLMGAVASLGLAIAFRADALSQEEAPTTMLAVLTATFMATWHSQPPMALMLIPILTILVAQGRLSRNLLFAWVLVPIVVFAFANVFFNLGIAHRAASGAILLFNGIFLAHAALYHFLVRPGSPDNNVGVRVPRP